MKVLQQEEMRTSNFLPRMKRFKNIRNDVR